MDERITMVWPNTENPLVEIVFFIGGRIVFTTYENGKDSIQSVSVNIKKNYSDWKSLSEAFEEFSKKILDLREDAVIFHRMEIDEKIDALQLQIDTLKLQRRMLDEPETNFKYKED